MVAGVPAPMFSTRDAHGCRDRGWQTLDFEDTGKNVRGEIACGYLPVAGRFRSKLRPA